MVIGDCKGRKIRDDLSGRIRVPDLSRYKIDMLSGRWQPQLRVDVVVHGFKLGDFKDKRSATSLSLCRSD